MSKDSHESGIQIEVCTPDYFDIQLDGLSSLLHACVNEGSSINFLLPFTTEEARDWWIGQRGNVEDGSLVLLLALAESPNNESKEVPGCVMMGLPPQPNQPHRVEVKKMLVHPKYRRRSVHLRFSVKVLCPDSDAKHVPTLYATFSVGLDDCCWNDWNKKQASEIDGF